MTRSTRPKRGLPRVRRSARQRHSPTTPAKARRLLPTPPRTRARGARRPLGRPAGARVRDYRRARRVWDRSYFVRMEIESTQAAIEALLDEQRTFPPSKEFAAGAVVKDESVYRRAEEDPEGFWRELAGEFIGWFKEPTKGLDWDPPHCTWFEDGELNVSWNCLDRHVEAGRGDRVAYHWVGEPGERDARPDLRGDAARGVEARERPAQARHPQGRPHRHLHGHGPRASDRNARVRAHRCASRRRLRRLLCGVARRAHARLRREASDHAGRGLAQGRQGAAEGERGCGSRGRTEHRAPRRLPPHGRPGPVERTDGISGTTISSPTSPTSASPRCMGAEDTLFLLHTSGTTAKPKGVQHTTAGYLLHVSVTHKWIFDIHDDTIWWCAADVGWVTGHSYIVYGPLSNGTTSVLYEGDPAYPDWDRHWEIVARYKVNSYYTAPTLIRSFVKVGEDYPARHDLSSLRLLGTVGEPINPEAWVWYWKVIGQERCPVVDTWWQTETGGILITPLPGITTLKPGSATIPFPGIKPAIVDEQGNPVPQGQGGFLTAKRPWPGMFRTLWEDDARYVENYFSKYGPGHVLHRRRREAGRRRLLLAHGPDRRRHQRRGPPALDDRDRVHARRARGRRRGSCHRRVRPRPRPAHRLLRPPEGRLRALRRARGGASGVRRGEDRKDRAACRRPLRRRPAEDPLREDHAPPAEGHRRRARVGGYDDASRRGRRGRPQAEGRRRRWGARRARRNPTRERMRGTARGPLRRDRTAPRRRASGRPRPRARPP